MDFPCFFFFFFFFFPIFDIARLRKIRQIHWKQRLEISKIAKFESYLLKTYAYEDIAPQSREVILQTFVWWGEGTNLSPPHHTNVRKFSQLSGAICSLD